jgi:hypothetical protein
LIGLSSCFKLFEQTQKRRRQRGSKTHLFTGPGVTKAQLFRMKKLPIQLANLRPQLNVLNIVVAAAAVKFIAHNRVL